MEAAQNQDAPPPPPPNPTTPQAERKIQIFASLENPLKSFKLLKSRKSHLNLQSGSIYPLCASGLWLSSSN